MNKKVISLLAAAVMAVQALVIPIVANAEAAATKGDIFIHDADFSEWAQMGGQVDGMAIQPGSGDPNSWLFKGSAGNHTEIFRKAPENGDDQNYGNFKSDSTKNGTVGEGSWYWYNRTNSGHIGSEGTSKKGYMCFDIRMNEGNINLDMGDFTDPTKGNANLAAQLLISSTAGQITATSSGGRSSRVASIEKGKWYTVQIDLDCNLQEYSVTVLDASGKELGKAEEIPFVTSACQEIKTKCFAYIRKEGGHDFDLRHVTIARVSRDLIPAKETAAATPEPTTTPEATAAPTAAPTDAPAAAPKKIVLTIDDTAMKVGDTTKTLDVPAQIINDRTMVPLRAIFEALDAEVTWDGDTRTVTGKKGDTTVVLVIDDANMKVNGETKVIDTPAQIVNDRTLVPARAISEALGADVQWDGATRVVTITAE